VRPWRWLYALAQVLDPADIKSVQVDTEWHIFSVYRAVYGIHYTEFLMLADAAAAAPSDAAAAAPSAATAERALTSSASSSETAASETAASSASGTGIVDTLFFPGCSLISYAPDLVRKVGAWLSAQGFSWALSDSCCGSPLISHGRPDRARVLRHRIVEQCRAAGIRRVLTVCPGCGDELLSLLAQEGIEVIPLPRLLAEAGVQVSSAAFAPTPATPTLAPAPAPAPSAAPATPTLTFFDSCHDRLQQHGIPIRRLFARLPSVELAHHCRNTLCCGAGGGVSSFDADISDRRLEHLLGEAADAGAGALVTTCPTCTYTFAYKRLLGSTTPVLAHLDCHHYLEYVFETPIDWPTVFSQLQDMWSGEYGEWVCSQLL
jgi:Fe-S oxidoreductase